MTKSDKYAALLQRLVESMIDEPAELVVDVVDNEDEGARAFRVTSAAPHDVGKLIGQEGAHARALRFVAMRLGRRIDERWEFNCRFTGIPKVPKPGPTRPPESHDPAQDQALLGMLLAALFESPPELATAPSNGSSFLFLVTPQTQADASALWDVEEFDVRRGSQGEPDEPYRVNLLTELDVLFRSIGRRQGVVYQIREAVGAAK